MESIKISFYLFYTNPIYWQRMTDKMDFNMTLEEAIKTRRSVRGFLEKPVPQDIIKKAFDWAQLSPSNSNTQPWKIFVASGESRDKIKSQLVELVSAGNIGESDFVYPEKFDDIYRKRQVDCAVTLYKEMKIARDDQEGRMKALLRNFEFFDAPHMAFICMEKAFPQTIAVDIGLYTQTLMLAFTAMGVATCSMGAMRNHPQVPREVFGFGENLGVLFGMAFGYEDPTILANKVRMDRVPVEESVMFLD